MSTDAAKLHSEIVDVTAAEDQRQAVVDHWRDAVAELRQRNADLADELNNEGPPLFSRNCIVVVRHAAGKQSFVLSYVGPAGFVLRPRSDADPRKHFREGQRVMARLAQFRVAQVKRIKLVIAPIEDTPETAHG